MNDTIEIVANGQPLRVARGISVASALLDAQEFAFRESTSGEPRGPLCGMGVCYECRVTIDDVAHRRACMTIVEQGMRVETGERRP